MANKGKAPKLRKFDEIVGGKIEFQIQGRVLNLWTTPDRFNATDVGMIHMILVDAEMTGPIVVPLADDLLATPRTTIEDLIESTEKCVGAVLARTCELEVDASKSMGKRGSEDVESLDDIVLTAYDTSTTKELRIVSVKVEDSD
ncbi:hypothetical protein MTR_3g011240 [Medicago truncatula]|uniref:Uncharacterized protein n=1 Tax=Medicago truncatula TaxID=3880 RepID=G7IVS4_MEDTR|nr:hypothetical protein MTR_3g011240 [Medicago truncatula]